MTRSNVNFRTTDKIAVMKKSNIFLIMTFFSVVNADQSYCVWGYCGVNEYCCGENICCSQTLDLWFYWSVILLIVLISLIILILCYYKGQTVSLTIFLKNRKTSKNVNEDSTVIKPLLESA